MPHTHTLRFVCLMSHTRPFSKVLQRPKPGIGASSRPRELSPAGRRSAPQLSLQEEFHFRNTAKHLLVPELGGPGPGPAPTPWVGGPPPPDMLICARCHNHSVLGEAPAADMQVPDLRGFNNGVRAGRHVSIVSETAALPGRSCAVGSEFMDDCAMDKNHSVRGSYVAENTLLMRGVRGGWPDLLKRTGRAEAPK